MCVWTRSIHLKMIDTNSDHRNIIRKMEYLGILQLYILKKQEYFF